jgi:glycosyltransferase involved in cell wall biosynthesis
MAGRWIAQCLESILAQTVDDFELIISDNCSSDDTLSIALRFSARDPRIRVVRQPENIGIAGNHTFTFLQCEAPYFCWLSANDVYDAHFLERCLAVLDGSPEVVLVGSRASTFFEIPGDGELLAEDRLPDVADPRQRLFAVMSRTLATSLFRGVFRRSVVEKQMPLQTMFGSDLVLVVEMAAAGRVVHLDEPLYHERISAGAWTTSVPLYLRARYYEPHSGVNCILFHRMRILLRYWCIAMRESKGAAQRLAAIPAMLHVMIDLRRLPVRDVREAAGLALAWLSRGPVLHRRRYIE